MSTVFPAFGAASASPPAASPVMPSAAEPRPVAAARLRRSRRVEQVVVGQPTSDGAGVRLTRILTQPLQRRLDPFLMLDAFGSDSADDYVGGFPDHPHRGFETVTVMLAGRMRHRDSVGNVGLLEPGSVQWMTAGRGLIHSEMPEQAQGRMAGFQLWVNLAATDKMQAPAYRDLPPAAVPVLRPQGEGADGAVVRVLAGACLGVAGAVQRPVTEPLLLDVTLPPGARLDVAIPPGHNAFVHVFAEPGLGTPVDIGPAGDRGPQGAARIGLDRMAILANPAPGADGAFADDAADGVTLAAPADAAAPARLLVVAGRPLREPIVQAGPFVMNTVPQIHEAIADFQAGRLAR